MNSKASNTIGILKLQIYNPENLLKFKEAHSSVPNHSHKWRNSRKIVSLILDNKTCAVYKYFNNDQPGHLYCLVNFSSTWDWYFVPYRMGALEFFYYLL